jgi:hypothetical protein
MLFLHSNGVSTSRAVRIYKTYGTDAVQLISENPYRLARDIPASHDRNRVRGRQNQPVRRSIRDWPPVGRHARDLAGAQLPD